MELMNEEIDPGLFYHSLMKIPMNDLKRAFLADEAELRDAVDRVISSGWYSLGPEVESFENNFAEYCGTKHAIGVGNGTDALILSLRALGIKQNDEVVVSANAGGYSTTAIEAVGAIPVYADIEPSTLSLDPHSVQEQLSKNVKAIILTHLFGSLGNGNALRSIADQAGVKLIEDCAQAHGACLGGCKAGSIGDAAAFSFYPSKNLGALGDAGAVLTSSDSVAHRLRQLRQYGWGPKYQVDCSGGCNSRLDPIQAAVLNVRLKKLDARNARRRDLVNRFAEILEPLGMPVFRSMGDSFVGHLCITAHPRREAFRRCLSNSGVATDIHYPVLDPDQPGWQILPSRQGDLSHSRKFVSQIFTLPLFPEMTDIEHQHICNAIVTASSQVHEGATT
jgi:dTDP-4-amino-4,6-dideoxygalactose transaminase